ncbi:MFS transporter [Parafrankia sp. EUN1f]|uniref:MFS transporter n=1 Tax=Parafrankia sp. EUN1f TaxID=102897 RepID=UPI0001C4785C|nr:MFS transporter [Parafrankia sp. EUN1f]EFC79255.1 major facilitator superfamily MFS_1 [Parafrankia sp. EUN1f]
MRTRTDVAGDDPGRPPGDPPPATPATPAAAEPLDPRRWLALSVLVVAQLMVVLDGSVVTIAIPSALRDLHMSAAAGQWVVTSYALAFGGLLLLGGRVADFLGRRRAFVWGLFGFAAASALGGAAPTAGLLIAARALQGVCAAVLTPAALSLITVTFTEGRERARAFAVYGAVSGGGAAIGLVAGGLLTEYASWRWCLLVNIPIALVTAAAAVPVIRESRAGEHPSYDVLGAVTVTAGLVALGYGFTVAAREDHGWASAQTVGLLVGAALLLAAFVVVEARSAQPLLPPRVPLERNRGGSFLAAALISANMLATLLFLTYYFQNTLGYSALRTGFAFLPISAGVLVAANLTSRLLSRLGAKALMLGGIGLSIAGMLLLTRLNLRSGYPGTLLPAEILISTGMGFAVIPMFNVSLTGVAPRDAGVASALVNVTQQIGGSLGVALLSTVSATAITRYERAHGGGGATTSPRAAIEGYTTAFTGSTAFLVVAFVVVLVLVQAHPAGPPTEGGPAAEPGQDVANSQIDWAT